MKGRQPTTPSTVNNLGRLLRCYRLTSELPIAAFAERLGISPATLSRVERGLPMTGTTVQTIQQWLWTSKET